MFPWGRVFFGELLSLGHSSVARVCVPSCALVVFAVLCACGRSPAAEPIDGFTVDARIVADGLCWLRCLKLRECDSADGEDLACEQTCVDETLATLSADPCWVETVEVRRCVARKLSCEAIEADEVPPPGGTACQAWVDRYEACEF